MSQADSQPVWRFRLKLLTALAVLVLAVLWLRSRADVTAVEKRRLAMLGSLRGLIAAQDAHQARTGQFATTLDSLGAWQVPSDIDFDFTALDGTSWRATVHDSSLQAPPTTCGVFVGRPAASPHRAVVDPGVPACW